MMKAYPVFVFTLILFFVRLNVNAQDSSSYKNAMMLEIGGNGFLYSVSYERFFYKQFNVRIGFSSFKIIENQTNKSMIIMSYPFSFNYLFNLTNQNHFVETGIGVMNLVTAGDLVEYKGVTNYYLNPFLNIGYRYEPPRNRLLYRIGLSPFLGTKSLTNPTEQGFQPMGSKIQIWGHIGIGYKF